jgi:hypothetical protein
MTSTECQRGGIRLFKNRSQDGKLNICGANVAKFRMQMEPKISQRALADKMQLENVDLDKNAIQKIESGQRFVTDLELKALSRVLNVTTDELLK